MKTHQHIVPAIIPDSITHLRSRLNEVHGVAQRIQIDVMNGSYTPSVSWPYIGTKHEVLAVMHEDNWEGLPYWQDFEFEIDLLIEKPEDSIAQWASVGVACLIVHVESTQKLQEIQEECYSRRLEMALAIKPSSDSNLLEPYVEQALFVQVMGSDRIGYNGVELEDVAIDKVREIHKRWPNLTIGVDIGVNAETLPKLCDAGATRFAAGSAVFNFGSPSGSVAHLENVAVRCIKNDVIKV